LSANTQYSLDIPRVAAGHDAVDDFLFETKTGFCEQIASSLVVMLRSLGVPARLTVGYTAGERNPLTGLFEVRASDAHAWTEVWFPDIGWMSFDPTADVPFADDGETALARTGLAAYLSAHVAPALGVIVRVVVVAVVVGVAGFMLLTGRRTMRRRRTLAARSWAARWHDDLDRAARRRGRPRAPGETARTYLAALDLPTEHTEPVLRTVDAATYTKRTPSPEETEAANALLNQLAQLPRASEVDRPDRRRRTPAHR
jgi:hypothetical protein